MIILKITLFFLHNCLSNSDTLPMCRFCRTVLSRIQKVRIKILIGNWRVQWAQSAPKVIESRRWKTTMCEIRYYLNGTGSPSVCVDNTICKCVYVWNLKASTIPPPFSKKTLKFCNNEFIYCTSLQETSCFCLS